MALLLGGVLSSCGEYNTVLKSTDYEYKYEAAKGYFAKGQNSRAATLLEELISILKGTANAEESAYMLAMTYFNQGDYISASHYLMCITLLTRVEPILNWHAFSVENRCIWIHLNRGWTRQVLIKPFRNYRCSSNTFRQVHARK